jgi:hypothetical protein
MENEVSTVQELSEPPSLENNNEYNIKVKWEK